MEKGLLRDILAFACEQLIDAGQIALGRFRHTLTIDNKLATGAFDPVTEADREVESFLRQRLTAAFPEFGVIGEEQGFTPGSSQVNWIVDPIDGTKSFISGLPTWGMLLGLVEGEQALCGLMHQPFTGELFVGSAEGSYWQGRGERLRLQTRQTTSLENATLYCTHEQMFANPDHLSAFHRVAERAKLVRFGADCYAYCMLAHGLIDLVVEDTLQPYDIIPLIPIIEGAGGVVTDPDGNSPLSGGFVVAAANSALHRQALELVNR
ncbi:MAG: histidinol-phosphatase [Desulfuromonas sp.]|nr:MAG: histidinol-phosphatase [Desulfuromonas sp.]